MKPKSKFVINVIWLTLMMIGGLSLAFIMIMIMAVEKELAPDRLMLALLGIVAGVFALLYILKINKSEESRRVDEAVNQHHEYIAHWKIDAILWKAFINERLKGELEENRTTGIAIALLLGVVGGLIGLSHLPMVETGLLAMVLAMLGFLIGHFGARKAAKDRFRKDTIFENGEIFFAKSLMVLNGQLIQVKDFGVRPLEVKLNMLGEVHVLSLKIQTGLANRKSVKQHQVPVPSEQLDIAGEICAHYSNLI